MISKTEYINDEIKFLAKSGIRLKILDELKQNPHTIRELVKVTGITYSSVSSNVTKLENASYISKINKRYEINQLSEIYFNTLMEFKRSVDLIDGLKEFWYKHNITQINEESLRNITDLDDSELIETTPLDIYKTHKIITEHLSSSKSLKAIFPYMHPDYPKLIEEILSKNGKVEIIMHENIYRAMIKNIDTGLRKKAAQKGKFKIHIIKKNVPIHLSVCDETMDLGLFKSDGSFDQNRLLTSEDEKSVRWADELFENIKENVIA